MSAIAEKIQLIETKQGDFTLKVCQDNGVSKTIHSLYDPEAEASSLVDNFKFDGKGILVVLGLGLGYHVAELAKKYRSAHIIVVESEQEIFNLAREHGPALPDHIEIITAQMSSDVLRTISRRQLQRGLAPIAVFPLSSAVSVFPDYYRPLLESLRKTASVRIWDRLRYPKFRSEKIICLLIDSGYFLVQEVEKALQSLNHGVVRISVRKESDNDDLISELMQTIVENRPDFILTLNHLGFDEAGELASFLKSIEMPAASWYVDSPKLIVRAFEKNISPYVSLFLWDRSYLADMRDMGFESLIHLPLATDENMFRPYEAKKHKKKIDRYRCNVGFVGNSMTEPVQEWVDKNRQLLHPVIEKVAEAMSSRGRTFEEAIKILPDPDKQDLQSLSKKEMAQFEAAVLWKATLLYRLSCIQRLEEFGLTIHGDRGWNDLISSRRVTLNAPLNYYKALPLFYNACAINFNATSLQMREAVNQRVFDVPACGAFLLTDQKESLNDLFDVGNEIITYSDKDEIPEVADFYLRHPDKRQVIAQKGRERVLRDHTYRKRLAAMIAAMKERYR